MMFVPTLLALCGLVTARFYCVRDITPESRPCAASGKLGPQKIDYLNTNNITALKVGLETCAQLANTNISLFDGAYVREPVSFSFKDQPYQNHQCILYNKTLQEQGFYHHHEYGDDFYYNSDCFHCHNVCPDPYNVNLLINGGFENVQGPFYSPAPNPVGGSIYPWVNNPTSIQAYQNSPGEDSGEAMGCSCGSYDSCNVVQQVATCADSYYFATFQYLLPYASQGQARLYLGDGALSVYQPYSFSTWKDGSMGVYRFANSTPGQLDFSFVLVPAYYSNVTMLVDNVVMQRMPVPVPTAPGATNLVVNGGFETGRLAPWAVHEHYVKLISPGANSTYAFRYGRIGQSVPNTNLLQTIANQTFGQRYAFGFDYQYDSTRPFLLQAVVTSFFDGQESGLYAPGSQTFWENWEHVPSDIPGWYHFERLVENKGQNVGLDFVTRGAYIVLDNIFLIPTDFPGDSTTERR